MCYNTIEQKVYKPSPHVSKLNCLHNKISHTLQDILRESEFNINATEDKKVEITTIDRLHPDKSVKIDIHFSFWVT